MGVFGRGFMSIFSVNSHELEIMFGCFKFENISSF